MEVDIWASRLPSTSLFLLKISFLLLIVPCLTNIVAAMVVLKLAWRCIEIEVKPNKFLVSALILGVVGFFIRQLIPIPYHILVILLVTAIVVKIFGKIKFFLALIATIFVEIIVFGGSIIIIEPLLVFSSVKIKNFLFYNPIGFAIGELIEVLFPFLILIIFSRYNISLFGRLRKDIRHDSR